MPSRFRHHLAQAVTCVIMSLPILGALESNSYETLSSTSIFITVLLAFQLSDVIFTGREAAPDRRWRNFWKFVRPIALGWLVLVIVWCVTRMVPYWTGAKSIWRFESDGPGTWLPMISLGTVFFTAGWAFRFAPYWVRGVKLVVSSYFCGFLFFAVASLGILALVGFASDYIPAIHSFMYGGFFGVAADSKGEANVAGLASMFLSMILGLCFACSEFFRARRRGEEWFGHLDSPIKRIKEALGR